jgi:hypothetical protein
VRGIGAGILGGRAVLGETEASVYPWHEYSDSTLSLQFATNYELQQRGMPLVTEDGVLGSETCGAQTYLSTEGLTDHAAALEAADCRSFAYPPAEAPPTTTPPPRPTVESPRTSQLSRRAGMGTVGWLLIAGGVAATGLYLAMGRKRR